MSLNVLSVALIVPPLSLLPVGLAGLVLAPRRRLGWGLMAASLLGLFVLALPVTGDALLASLEGGLPLTTPLGDPPTAIVVLGGDTNSDLRTGSRDVGALTLERLRAGAELQRRTGLPLLVSGGPLGPGAPALATLMQRSLQADFAVPTRWVEPESNDTWENARDSAAILKPAGVRSVYVVTHAWHMRRALLAFAPTGLRVTAAPVRMDGMPTGEWTDFVPRASSWSNSFFALHEWIGCLYYAL